MIQTDNNKTQKETDKKSPINKESEKKVEEKTESEEKADGYFYSTNGEFLGKESTSMKVYLAKSYEKTKDPKTDKVTIKYKEVIDLEMSHDDFCYIGGIIKHEAGKNDLTELKCIAFTSYNEATGTKKTWRALLASSYSSVPSKDSQKLKDNTESKTDSQKKSNNTRKAMIAVLTKEEDITKGATFWDGTDFLAWGTDENKFDSATKIGHNKFREYKFVEIPKEIYDTFLDANKNASRTYTMKVKHDTTKCSGKHEHVKKKNKDTGKEEDTGKIKYPMPAAVFENTEYWSASCFYYDTGIKTTYGISATVAAGRSIFWKKTKDRLCTDTTTTENTTSNSERESGSSLGLPDDLVHKNDNTTVVIQKKHLDLEIVEIKNGSNIK